MSGVVSHRWSHLRDLPSNYEQLHDRELDTLKRVWLEQRDGLEKSGLVKPFLDRLVREYAIEGGIIERAYTLDRGVTQLLIEKGIDASLIPQSATDKDPLYVARMIHAHQDAVEAIFDLVKGNRPLSTSIIKELHSVLLKYQSTTTAVDSLGRVVEVPLSKGEYKRLPNNPLRPDGSIHEYSPPEHVAAEMDRMIDLHREHVARSVPADVEAVWLHHVFTQIHPFQDGNGRIARLLASYVFIKDQQFPLALRDDQDRGDYIVALELADKGDLRPLLRLFAMVQRRTFVKALGIAGDVQQQVGRDQIIAAARKKLAERQRIHQQKLESAKRTARSLHQLATHELNQLARKLHNELASGLFRVDTETNEGHRRHYFRQQVVEVAKTFDYFANLGVYHDWTRLVLRTEDQAEILLSLHCVGYEFRGVLAAAVVFFRRSDTEDEERQVSDIVPACRTVFQINYLEEEESVRKRFAQWLDEALTTALANWQAGL